MAAVWLFAPVWTLLYATIALAGWLVWREPGFEGEVVPLSVYGVQLLWNAAWSPIFFGLQQIGWVLLEMVFCGCRPSRRSSCSIR